MDEKNNEIYNLVKLFIEDDEKIYALDPLTNEKTEIYDFLCNLAIRQEEEKMVLVKIIRRVTVYRNKNGRLVNVNIGDTQEIVKPFPF